MGPGAIRITSQDFLIPPEYRHHHLAERSAGQVGGVRLGLVASGGRTVLGSCYQQVPLRVLPPFHFGDEPAALLYLLNPTAGLMDGDGHLIEIEAKAGACAVVTGQSATRVHPAVSSFATQQWHIRAAAGARLVVLPGPNIPYKGCRFHQRVRIDLEGDARLIWAEIWTPGRYERLGGLAEHYQFERIIQELEVHHDGDLVYRDRFDWNGPWDRQTAAWYVGDGPNAASAGLFVTGEVAREADGHDQDGHEHGSGREVPSLRRSVLALAEGDTLIRWCGPAPELVAAVVREALGLAAGWAPEASSRPWLIGGHHLNPSHWFSVLERPA
jgi:urease accessory protein